MDYIPITEKDTKKMLDSIGVNSISELVREFIPAIPSKLNLPQAKSEFELVCHMKGLAETNNVLRCFAGAGVTITISRRL